MWWFFSRFVKKIDGLENLPAAPAIIVANHESDVDGPLLYFLLTKFKNQQVFPIVTDERVANWFGDLLVRHFGGARVHSGAVAKAHEALEQGKYVLIFPEGQRTFDGKLQKVSYTGIGVLAVLSKAPVVPVHITSYQFWSRHMARPSWKNKMKITIGIPRVFHGKVKKGWVDKRDAKNVVARVMQDVKLLGK